jgi:uncharacterized protein
MLRNIGFLEIRKSLLAIFFLIAIMFTGCIENRTEIMSNGKNRYKIPATEHIRKNGNHLANESSVYLKQHAYNPVDWYPWGDEALGRAREEDKPIFLSVGYSSCHWCHVMEEESFDSERIATYLNENFICIKVDREERPDLDAVFMQAVQMISGGGGWPMSVFITPDQKPFFGGTYFPPDRFFTLINQINDAFKTKRELVDGQSEELYSKISTDLPTTKAKIITKDEIKRVVQQSVNNLDSVWGGFRGAMKFPTPLRWHFLLHEYRLHGDQNVANAVRTTLDNMGSGGIHDHIAGGFHRYTTERTWLIPHFEKMLYDNAQIASLYIEAYAVFKDERYGEIARKTLDFMIRDMHEPGNGFFSSYDADSGGEEGSYYSWKPSELGEVVSKEDLEPLAMILGITYTGNFEGSNVLTRRKSPEEVAEKFGRDVVKIENLFDSYREKLRHARDKRVKPGLDKKIVTSWNGLTISALSKGYQLFGDNRYLIAAEDAASMLIDSHQKDDGSYFRTSTDGIVKGDGILDDYAFIANGFLDLFQATSNIYYLEKGLELIDYVQKNFRNKDGGYYLTPEDTKTPLGRQVEVFDAVEPSGNSSLMIAFLKASAITGNSEYRKEVERLLGYYSDVMKRSGVEMGRWLDVVTLLTNSFHEIIIAGDITSDQGRELYEVYRNVAPSYSTFINVLSDGADDKMLKLLPSLQGKIAIDGRTTAYVCQYGSCQEPTSDPTTLRSQILSGWMK